MAITSRLQSRTALVIAAMCAILSAGAQAAGNARTETRAATGFNGIALGVPADVELRQGTTEGVSITADADVLARIETVVEGGTLRIRWAKGWADAPRTGTIAIVVDARGIGNLSVGGTGRIHAERLATRNLRADIGGAGQVAIDALDAATVGVSIGGSGTAKLAGRAETFNVSVAGSGELVAGRLATRDAHVSVTGSSTAAVRASDTLSASVVGSATVRYYGSPKVSRSVVGTGRVIAAADAT
ncbi:MAG: head GIN domain-containing protein [Burkholderiales bacterium]